MPYMWCDCNNIWIWKNAVSLQTIGTFVYFLHNNAGLKNGDRYIIQNYPST